MTKRSTSEKLREGEREGREREGESQCEVLLGNGTRYSFSPTLGSPVRLAPKHTWLVTHVRKKEGRWDRTEE